MENRNPSVTFLASPGNDMTVMFGKAGYRFAGGKTKKVPPAVALHCAKLRDRKGKAVFSIDEMPTIISPVKTSGNEVEAVKGKTSEKGWNQLSLLAEK